MRTRAQPVQKRVADLLARMTLDGKIGQLQQLDRNTNDATDFSDQLRQRRIRFVPRRQPN